MVQEAERYKKADEEQRERVSAKNALESYAFSMKQTIEDEKVKDKINESDRKQISDACASVNESTTEQIYASSLLVPITVRLPDLKLRKRFSFTTQSSNLDSSPRGPVIELFKIQQLSKSTLDLIDPVHTCVIQPRLITYRCDSISSLPVAMVRLSAASSKQTSVSTLKLLKTSKANAVPSDTAVSSIGTVLEEVSKRMKDNGELVNSTNFVACERSTGEVYGRLAKPQ
ncbi:Heat shock cognate 71 kDa protein [Fasciola hepatica]|uniref:Heat shock cognate 71 kDa protein n=1 Tax=Fasciola hepatica TaxID=6192 RepID=A0A4E0S0Y1_FASHE|nr:Heat shock cognate 71 kDa protein [Fasciola hepatica]